MKARILILPVPVLTPRLSSYWLDLVTAVPADVVRPLIDGLRHDLLADDAAIRNLIPLPLSSYADAVRAALAAERAEAVPARWTEGAFAYRGSRPDVSYYSRRLHAEAQAAVDAWVHEYNHSREHQSLGNRPPIERFATARPERRDEHEDLTTSATEQPASVTPRLIRRVLVDGKVSLLNFNYHVGRYLAGQSVELVSHDRLVEIFHDGVLIATHARRHPPEQEEHVLRQALAATPTRPTTDRVVIRKVGHEGEVSFAGADYRVGNAFTGRQVEVALAGDTVQIWGDGTLLRTHAAKHDRRKEHGAFANPGGRPDRTNAA